jgi:pyruvate formate lyase activating enzyme
VRENTGGELRTLVYGKPCSIHVDPMEKKPLFHFLPGSPVLSIATAGCNLHCRFCQNWEISQRPPEETENFDLPPEQVVALAVKNRCPAIAYTYNDPVVYYEYAYDTSKLAREKGIRNVLVTAGYINEKPLRELCTVIDAAHVDLKGDDDHYREICSGTLAPVQRTIEIMKKAGVWVEVINLVVPTLNDSPEKIRWLAKWLFDAVGPDVPLHFSRFHPIYRLKNLPPTPVETLRQAHGIAREIGLRYVYIGNVSGLEQESTFCPKCGKIVIGRKAYFVGEKNLQDGKCAFCGETIAGVWG